MILIGNIYKSNNYGLVKVINRVNNDIYTVEFLDTGTIDSFSGTAIRHGRIKDKFAKTVANTGYIGDNDIKITDANIYAFYRVWNDMINRCYNVSDHDYPYYGGIGISVDITWHCFATFLNDIQFLPNYDKKCKYPSLYNLDKDYLQLNIPKQFRVYSKFTCLWLSRHDNSVIVNHELYSDKYRFVCYRDGRYYVRQNNKLYGAYDDPIAAANAANILIEASDRSNPHAHIKMYNDVPKLSHEEINSHLLNQKLMYTLVDKDSTTIRDECSGVGDNQNSKTSNN